MPLIEECVKKNLARFFKEREPTLEKKEVERKLREQEELQEKRRLGEQEKSREEKLQSRTKMLVPGVPRTRPGDTKLAVELAGCLEVWGETSGGGGREGRSGLRRGVGGEPHGQGAVRHAGITAEAPG